MQIYKTEQKTDGFRQYASIKTNQEPRRQVNSQNLNPLNQNSNPTTNKLMNPKTNNEIVELEANIRNFMKKWKKRLKSLI